mmetsp:Transcript_19934/g.28557  ORF Transcript_19934/g.28557 Transcript_19934/m.28557 type:complete len:321 (-) Transcript_19934:711-1673(-)
MESITFLVCQMLRQLFQTKKQARLFANINVRGISNQLCSKLCLLGGGQMAEAILNAITKKGVQEMKNVNVYDISKDRLNYLKEKYGITPCSDPSVASKEAEIIIIAVKPQNVSTLAHSLVELNSEAPTGLVLSIVAGLTLSEITKQFRTNCIIRSMPNTPSMVLEGITVWTATTETPPELLEKARKLLATFGEQIEVADESYLDMATAISGSGPAYIFLTMEAMIDAAVHMGFPRETAKKLVLSTIRGSASYAQRSSEAIPTLKNNVTSPGGTTASALYQLERGGFRTVVADAIWAAYRKALELGGNDSNVGPGRSRGKQ